VIILVHEFGHFGAAKLFKMNVYQFNLGMGPILWKKQHKETQYALRLLPIGGSCMLGEDDSFDIDPSEEEIVAKLMRADDEFLRNNPDYDVLSKGAKKRLDSREFRNKPVWQRIIVIAGGAILNVVLGFILCVILNIASPIASMEIGRFTQDAVSNSGASALQINDRILSVNGMTIISADEIHYKMDNSLTKRSDDTVLTTTVVGFRANSVSNRGENPLMESDRIIGVNGVTVTDVSEILNNVEIPPLYVDEFFAYYRLVVERDSQPIILENVRFAAHISVCRKAFLDSKKQPVRNENNEILFCGKSVFDEQNPEHFGNERMFCEEDSCGKPTLDDDDNKIYTRDFNTVNDFALYDFVVVRDGEKLELNGVRASLQFDARGEPRINDRGGLSYTRDFVPWAAKKNFANIMEYSFRDVVGKGRIIWLSLIDIVNGTYGINDLSGPVGIAGVVNTVAEQAVDFKQLILSVLQISAFITVNLGIVNLLPIPALDGARILFLTAEGIRRKPLNVNTEAVIHFVGFALLMLLIIVVTFNDVRKLIFGG